MREHRFVSSLAAMLVLVCGCDLETPLGPRRPATNAAATFVATDLSERPVLDGGAARVIQIGAGLRVVHVGGNSSGCATTSLTTCTGGSSALINATPASGLFLIFGMEAAGSTAPFVAGAPFITVGGTNYPLVFLRRHSSGKRANELWWIPPPSPTGSPMIFSVTATFSEAVYYHAMLFSVTGMGSSRPVRADSFSSGPGSSYSTTVRPTGPQGACVEYANGACDLERMAPHHYCAVGRFQVGYSWEQAGAGSTTLSGTMSETGATDWLHSVWEIAP